MKSVTLRAVKGLELTHKELDDNFDTLNKKRYISNNLPNSSDDISKNFLVGSEWKRVNGDGTFTLFECISNELGLATWRELKLSGSNLPEFYTSTGNKSDLINSNWSDGDILYAEDSREFGRFYKSKFLWLPTTFDKKPYFNNQGYRGLIDLTNFHSDSNYSSSLIGSDILFHSNHDNSINSFSLNDLKFHRLSGDSINSDGSFSPNPIDNNKLAFKSSTIFYVVNRANLSIEYSIDLSDGSFLNFIDESGNLVSNPANKYGLLLFDGEFLHILLETTPSSSFELYHRALKISDNTLTNQVKLSISNFLTPDEISAFEALGEYFFLNPIRYSFGSNMLFSSSLSSYIQCKVGVMKLSLNQGSLTIENFYSYREALESSTYENIYSYHNTPDTPVANSDSSSVDTKGYGFYSFGGWSWNGNRYAIKFKDGVISNQIPHPTLINTEATTSFSDELGLIALSGGYRDIWWDILNPFVALYDPINEFWLDQI